MIRVNVPFIPEDNAMVSFAVAGAGGSWSGAPGEIPGDYCILSYG